MEKHGMYDEMLSGLDEVHLSVRARRQAESNMRRAAAIVDLLVGKSGADDSGGQGTKAHAVTAEREKIAA